MPINDMQMKNVIEIIISMNKKTQINDRTYNTSNLYKL